MKTTLSFLVLLLGAPVLAVPVSVSVVDSKGAPIAGADVQVQAAGKIAEGAEAAVSDEKGVVTFNIEPNSTEPTYAGRVLAWKQGFALGGGTLFFKGLRVTLAAPTSVSGTLTDENGKAVAGATVRASYLRAPSANFGISLFDGPSIREQIKTVSGADGKWHLDHIPPDVSASLAIRAAGRVNANIQIASGASVQTVLGPGAQIGGSLLGLDGKPLAGVRVSASEQTRDYGSRSFGEAETGADGAFTIGGLKKGVYKVAFSPKDDAPFVVAPKSDVAATPETPVQLPDFQAIAGTLIGGIISASDTKTPLAGVSVMLQSDEDTDHYESATTDDKGVWRMRTLERAAHLYIGGAPLEFNVGGDRQRRALSVGEENTGVNFALARNLKISGRFVDENGKGVQTSAFVLRQNNRGDEFALASDAAGNFSAFVPREGELTIGISRWNEAPDGANWIVASASKVSVAANTPLEIKLKRAQLSSLEVGVFDQDDVAIEGVKVVVNVITPEGETQSWRPHELVSDKSGLIRLSGIRSDQKVDFGSATKEGFDTAPLPKLQLQNGVYRADVSLKRRNGKAQGQVLDAAGASVVGAQIFGGGLETKSDAAGRFLLAPLPDGKVDILAWKDDGFALGQSDSARLELKPQALEPTSLERAKEVLAALKIETQNTGYWRRDSLDSTLANGDFSVSASSARASGIGGIARVITRFREDQTISIERWIALLQSPPKPAERLYNAAMWANQAPSVPDTDATRTWIALLQTDVESIEKTKDESEKWQNVIGFFGTAALCERIGDTDAADALFERGTAFVIGNFPEKSASRQTQTQDRMLASLAEMVAVSPRFLNKLAALIETDSPSYSTLLRNGTPVLTRLLGLDAAKPFLDKLKNAPTPKADENEYSTNIGWSYSQAVVDSIVAGAKSNPQLALELASSLPKTQNMGNDDARARAVCEAAFFQSPDFARTLWRENLPKLEGSVAMKFITRMAQTDEPLARGFYETARAALDAQPDTDPNAQIYNLARQTVAFAWYEARFAPARARVRLERGFQSAQKSPNARYELNSYARAMALFDADRALLWADQIGNENNNFAGFEAKRRIARFLSLDEKARRKINFGDRLERDDDF